MIPITQLGAWTWVFGAMTLAIAGISLWQLGLRRGPWQPLENKLNIAGLVIAAGFPIVGFLGTVAGLMHAFRALKDVSADQKQALLSKGISEAMNCTWYGLLLAVPASIIVVVLFATGAKRAPKKQATPSSR